MTGTDPTTDAVFGTPERWSGRWSGRVDGDQAAPPVSRALTALSGHESMSPSARPLPRPNLTAKRRGQLQLLAIQQAMSKRDEAILHTVATLRYVSTSQLECLHFADHASPDAAARICRRVLQRLHGWRIVEHLERRVGGVRAGSRSFVWRVGVVGDRVLRALDQAPRDRRAEPSLRFLDHSLAIGANVIDLTLHARASQYELLQWDVEPATWRSYLGAGGARQVIKPDLYAVTASGDFEDHWFIEIDRSTESMPTVIEQCQQYEAYRRTGRLQSEIEVFPFVVWVVPDETRAAKLQAAIQRSRGLQPDHYRVVVHGQLGELVAQGVTS